MLSKIIRICPVVFLLLGAGCATVPYRQGVRLEDSRLPPEPFAEVQIVRGRPNRFLDASDWMWPGSWLRKLVLWDVRVDNHHIGEETEAVLAMYLAVNELDHVKVRLNQYAPGNEFRRIVANKSMGAGWRYTLGMFSWLQYTFLPGRFFGGDHYNPYSNTISLYTDIPAIAVHEGGHAKDFAGETLKGTYAFIYLVPFFNLNHEARASNDALGYLRAYESPELQREGYRILHPAYGTYLGTNIAIFLPDRGLLYYSGAILGGHITGRFSAADISDLDEKPEYE
ncbi:MAG: hypothetical protein WD708_06225 [Kiritimatiellia bacterium]